MVPKRTDAGTNFAIGRRAVWECTTAGTSAAAEPTWPAAVTYDTTTVTSNTAVFTARKPGFSSGTTADWTFATIYSDYLGAAVASGDTVYISNNDAESYGEAWTSGFISGAQYICVSDSAAPPTAEASTATITTVGDFGITLFSAISATLIKGIAFISGSTATGTASITGIGAHLVNCSLRLAGTGSTSRIALLGGAELESVTVKFGAATQGITAAKAR